MIRATFGGSYQHTLDLQGLSQSGHPCLLIFALFSRQEVSTPYSWSLITIMDSLVESIFEVVRFIHYFKWQSTECADRRFNRANDYHLRHPFKYLLHRKIFDAYSWRNRWIQDIWEIFRSLLQFPYEIRDKICSLWWCIRSVSHIRLFRGLRSSN